tara:strand:+ start:754 stop:1056 length:303 start_codon:yes stop_codon:yes gene_type:complete
MRPDKAKVVDEVWTDSRIKEFLNKGPMGAENSMDFSALLYAYRSMRPEDFSKFIKYFSAAGRDLNARSNEGFTLTQIISTHEKSAPFQEIMRSAIKTGDE